jgi:hypothetical protein
MAVYDRKLLNIAYLVDLLELNVTANIVSGVLCGSGMQNRFETYKRRVELAGMTGGKPL